MTLVLVWKGLVFGGSPSKKDVIWSPGMYTAYVREISHLQNSLLDKGSGNRPSILGTWNSWWKNMWKLFSGWPYKKFDDSLIFLRAIGFAFGCDGRLHSPDSESPILFRRYVFLIFRKHFWQETCQIYSLYTQKWDFNDHPKLGNKNVLGGSGTPSWPSRLPWPSRQSIGRVYMKLMRRLARETRRQPLSTWRITPLSK